jgi:hypothetical protein
MPLFAFMGNIMNTCQTMDYAEGVCGCSMWTEIKVTVLKCKDSEHCQNVQVTALI